MKVKVLSSSVEVLTDKVKVAKDDAGRLIAIADYGKGERMIGFVHDLPEFARQVKARREPAINSTFDKYNFVIREEEAKIKDGYIDTSECNQVEYI